MQVRKTQVTEGGLRKYGKWKYKQHQIRIRGKRKYGKQKYEFVKGENAITENTSTNLRGGKHKYENVKCVYCAFPLACLTLN